jgi:ribosomal protein S18 acetylase RimI-like enzyme
MNYVTEDSKHGQYSLLLLDKMERLIDNSPEMHRTTLADVVKIRQLQANVWRSTYPSDANGVSQEWVDQETASWLTPEKLQESETFLGAVLANADNFHEVAYDNDEVIGFIHGSRVDGNQRLEGLYVDPRYHGQGTARRLTDDLFAWFDPSKNVVLEVASYNDRAKAFYRKYGFEDWYDEEEKFKGVIPSTKMIRKGAPKQ